MKMIRIALKNKLKDLLDERQRRALKNFLSRLNKVFVAPVFNFLGRYVLTQLNKLKNSKKQTRYLEIGPGPSRIKEFETLNVFWASNVDYVADASKKLPFKTGTFDLVYASHCLEHIAWYQVKDTLCEWVRIIKPGGKIEVWVPNGLEIARAFVDAEDEKDNRIDLDGWYKFNTNKDPCVWANGRIFSYGDGNGTKIDPNWHMCLFSARYLKSLMESCGLMDVVPLQRSQVRGHDHGWINLGFTGTKK